MIIIYPPALSYKMKKKRKHKRVKLTPYPRLYKKARKVFAKWIVKRDRGICFTCGNPGNQAGHGIHRNCFDFDEVMNNCQDKYCNHFLSGNLGVYAVKIDEKYGVGTYKEYLEKSHEIRKFTRSELEEIIERYK